MTIYAQNTEVSVEKTRAEIERTLRKYGAGHFAAGWSKDEAVIGFTFRGMHIRFDMPLPDPKDEKFRPAPPRARRRSPQDAYSQWEQACRQRWRALLISIKGKLEAVESGIAMFEKEFLAYIVLPGNETVGDLALPQVAQSYKSGIVQPLPALPAGDERKVKKSKSKSKSKM